MLLYPVSFAQCQYRKEKSHKREEDGKSERQKEESGIVSRFFLKTVFSVYFEHFTPPSSDTWNPDNG
jgi:hypothetical protein